ncbi:MAG: ATPase, T2SS/T4P/T4SS family, partial [Myxococcota bacterium]
APAGVPEMAAPTGPVSMLDNVELFQPLSMQIKQQLEAQLSKRLLQQNEVLFNVGDVGDAMYIIATGRVSVFITDATLGLTYELAQLGPGQAVGEMALITGAPRSAAVKALEPTGLLVLSRETFYQLVTAVPQVAITIAGVLAKRLDVVNKSSGGIEFGSLRGKTFDAAMLEFVPVHVMKRHKMIPLGQSGGSVTIATPDPGNRMGLDDLKRMLRGMHVKVMAVSENDYNTFIAQNLNAPQPGQPKQASKSNFSLAGKNVVFHGLGDKDEDAKLAAQAASGQDVANLASAIIVEAIERGVSDIHIEPDRKGVLVRYRIDGRMQVRDGTIPISLHTALMSRLKILAQLNITERRLPQDGRISLDLGQKGYDLRVATLNTKYGEKCVMRILDSSNLDQDLGSLIVAEKVAQVVRKLFYRPNGLVLVTGPTGSGKTTTLYAALRERMNPEVAICTVEDPIEYDLPGVTQVQVNESIGLNFAEAMRAFMRQDPDVILLGETRDATTARLACNAALTGHLVLSSMHTNDAISAVVRLRDMQVEPFVLSSALLGVINQRLVRRICPACRVPAPPAELVVKNLMQAGVQVDANTKFFKGAGCEVCKNEGFKGRVGVYELLVIGPKVRDAIASEAQLPQLRAAAMDGSYVPLSRFATHLLAQGLTVPSEVLRILPRDEGHIGT